MHPSRAVLVLVLLILSLTQPGKHQGARSAALAVPTPRTYLPIITKTPPSPWHLTRLAANYGSPQIGPSTAPVLSADGRYIAFHSSDPTLVVPHDPEYHEDIFVHDRQTGQLMRVSVNSAGIRANGRSFNPAISADGRYIAFETEATNLVPDDTNMCPGWCTDIFVHDRHLRQTTRVSVASDGQQANHASHWSTISADGRYVAFISEASNLVPGDTNNVADIFVHDRQTRQTTRVSVASNGTQGNGQSSFPVLSPDGRYVAFNSAAINLVPGATPPCFSEGGCQLYVHDRQTRTTTRLSVAADATPGNGVSSGAAFSADGRYIAFGSSATNLVAGDTDEYKDIFVHDRQSGQTTRLAVTTDGSDANGSVYAAMLSGDGRYVAFHSHASNIVPGDTNVCYFRTDPYNCSDIFVHDRQTGRTVRVSVAADSTQGDSDSVSPTISADGRHIVFHSYAANLVPGDTTASDVFIATQTAHGSVVVGPTRTRINP